MRKRFTPFLCTAALVLLTACTTQSGKITDYSSKLPALGSDEARLFVYRPASVSGKVRPMLYLDGAPLGKILPGEYLIADTTPGKHRLSAKMGGKPLFTFEILPGREAFVAISRDKNSRVWSPYFTVVKLETAKPYIDGKKHHTGKAD